MSVAKVVRLDEYRDRRAHRLSLAEALHRADPSRHAIVRHLREVADLTRADRVATVWVDEYGADLVHPHVVLDQLNDRPRRAFSIDPLHEAWQLGVPSACDRPGELWSAIPSTFAVSLGSDGTRAWFLIAESVAARSVLDVAARDRIMFLAGECAAVLLHRDLDAMPGSGSADAAGSRFAGWHILADLEGRESNEAEGRVIAQRFIVGRLVRMLVDDDLTYSPERLEEQVRRARAEMVNETDTMDSEVTLRHRVLDALEGARLEDLATSLVELGDVVEAQGHDHGALELYSCAYAVAAAIVAPEAASEAARLSGRLLRRRADWDEAHRWYEIAREVAERAKLHHRVAQVLVGLAVIKKETGNLPAARRGFREALTAAERSADRDAIAFVHHGLLGLEQAAGNLAKGLEHGWIAAGTYESEEGRTRCMASLAAALIDYGDLDAAEDAWTLVAHTSRDKYYLIYAHDALGHLSALKGDVECFEEHSARCDALGWESGSLMAKAEILYYRGLSYCALGNPARAKRWLTRAVAFAEEHQYNQVLFRAEEALHSLSRARRPERTPPSAAPPEVREGLRAMRRDLVGAEG